MSALDEAAFTPYKERNLAVRTRHNERDNNMRRKWCSESHGVMSLYVYIVCVCVLNVVRISFCEFLLHTIANIPFGNLKKKKKTVNN